MFQDHCESVIKSERQFVPKDLIMSYALALPLDLRLSL